MYTYCAFLRAINVGGHRIIKMELLSQIFKSAGFKDVKMYIQSGNVIFSSLQKDKETLINEIENQILVKVKFDVKTFLKTPEEMLKIFLDNPFGEIFSENLKLYIAFLSERPDKNRCLQFENYGNENEKFIIENDVLYALCRKDAGKLLFSNMFIEKKLNLQSTIRDWNTIKKITELTKLKSE